MKSFELVDSIVKLIFAHFAPPVGEPQHFTVGNHRFIGYTSSQLRISEREDVLVEVAVGDVPIHVWRITRVPSHIEDLEDGRTSMFLHSLYTFLLNHGAYTEILGLREDGTQVTANVIKENPISADSWRTYKLVLIDANYEPIVSVECSTNTLWKKEMQQEFSPTGVADQHRARSGSIPFPGSSSHRAASLEQRVGSAQSSRGSGSLHHTPAIQAHLAYSTQPPFVGSVSSVRPGTSPASYSALLRSPPPGSQEFPKLHNREAGSLPNLDDSVAYTPYEILQTVANTIQTRLPDLYSETEDMKLVFLQQKVSSA